MPKILRVRQVSDFSSYMGQQDRHPLVSVLDFEKLSPVRHTLNYYEVYGLFMHTNLTIDLTYGRGKYDYANGTLICVAPGQVGGKEDNGELINLDGWALLFHPDLIRGTHVEQMIERCTFFEYRVNETLHTTDEEREMLTSLVRQIRDEIDRPHDDMQNNIIVSYIETLLNYCQRFYNRQFMTRRVENTDMMVRFHDVLVDYFKREQQLRGGLPTVQYCADRLFLSPGYFGDMVKQTTGDNARNYIRRFVVSYAKNLMGAGKTVTETAWALGFDYPQHFTRVFKKQTGQTPSEYVNSLHKH